MESKPINSTPPLEDSRLKAAIAGQYRLSIATCYEEAWDRLKGFKKPFWLTLIILTLITVLLNAMSELIQIFILPIISQVTGILFYIPNLIIQIVTLILGLPVPTADLVFSLITQFILLPLYAGIMMLCIYYVGGKSISIKMIFNYYTKPFRYFFSSLWVLCLIGFSYRFLFYTAGYLAANPGLHEDIGLISYAIATVIFIPISIYFMVAYFFTMPLLANRKLKTWQALEASRMAVTRHFFRVFLILVLMVIILILPALAIILCASLFSKVFFSLFFVYTWILPYIYLVMAILYREIFGIVEN